MIDCKNRMKSGSDTIYNSQLPDLDLARLAESVVKSERLAVLLKCW